MDDWLEVGLGGAFAFVEAIFGLGIFLPGEVVVTGIAATVATEQRAVLFGAVVLGATLGDHFNYWLGRVLGHRLGRSRLVDEVGRHHWERAVDMVRRHGAWAIVISRLLPVVRTLMAAVAGVSRMPYRRFALASLAGSVLWSAVWVGAGGAMSNVIANPVIVVLAVAGLLGVLWLRSRWASAISRRRGDVDLGFREPCCAGNANALRGVEVMVGAVAGPRRGADTTVRECPDGRPGCFELLKAQ